MARSYLPDAIAVLPRKYLPARIAELPKNYIPIVIEQLNINFLNCLDRNITDGKFLPGVVAELPGHKDTK